MKPRYKDLPGLWVVSGTIDVDLIVQAETKEEAKKVARENWREELRNSGAEPDFRPIDLRQNPDAVYGYISREELQDYSPYVARERDGTDWNVADWIAGLVPAVRDSNQLALPKIDSGTDLDPGSDPELKAEPEAEEG